MDRPKLAIIERTGATCAPEQADLHRELWRLGWQSESVDPQQPAAEFDPRAYRLVVNRLSATAYDVDAVEPVFVRAKTWLERAEQELGAARVWNGPEALLVDASKLRQQTIFDTHGVGPTTQPFRNFDAITSADGAAFHGRPVFLKLVAGGSGKGTIAFPSFAALQEAIATRSFPTADGEAGYDQLEQTSGRLQSNLRLLFPHEPAHTVIVQQAIDFDPTVEVFQRFLQLKPTPPRERSRWVLRVECWDGVFRFGAWMATTGTNYCHAQGCDSHRPQSVIRLADDEAPVPSDVLAKSVAIAKDAGMRLAGIEWLREQGQWLAIDINGLSIMRTLYQQGVWEIKNGRDVSIEGPPSGAFLPWRSLAERLVQE